MRSNQLVVGSRGIVLLAVTGVVALTTLVLFFVLQPANAGLVYWMVAVDVVLMVLLTGISTIVRAVTATQPPTAITPPALQIAIGATMTSYLIAGGIVSVAIALLSAFVPRLELACEVVLVLKWLVLLILVVAMRSAGFVDAGSSASREASRRLRTDLLLQLKTAIDELRAAHPSQPVAAQHRSVVDQLESARNKVQAWVSSTPESADADAVTAELIGRIAAKTAEFKSRSGDPTVTEVLEIMASDLRRLEREVARSGRRTVSGLS